jgi:hypothetical protein
MHSKNYDRDQASRQDQGTKYDSVDSANVTRDLYLSNDQVDLRCMEHDFVKERNLEETFRKVDSSNASVVRNTPNL